MGIINCQTCKKPMGKEDGPEEPFLSMGLWYNLPKDSLPICWKCYADRIHQSRIIEAL